MEAIAWQAPGPGAPHRQPEQEAAMLRDAMETIAELTRELEAQHAMLVAQRAALENHRRRSRKAMRLLGSVAGILVAFVERHSSPERATHAGQTVRDLTGQVLAACRAADWHVAPDHAAALRRCEFDPY